MIDEPILIWGAGAIGGVIGAFLRQAGLNPRFVDVDAEHVSAMQRSGLAIHGPVQNFSISIDAFLPHQLQGRFRWVLLCVKAHHTASAVARLRPFLADDGVIVSLQNGLCEKYIAKLVGFGRTVGAFINFGADYTAPGEILYGNRGAVVIGELDGRETPRVKHLRDSLAVFEPETRISDNILGYLWGKNGYGALLKASALTNDTIADFIGNADLRSLHVAIVREILLVAQAEGQKPVGFNGFNPDAFLRADDEAIDRSLADMVVFNRGSGKPRSGIWRDLAVRKRRTECAAQVAPVLAAAEAHGLEMPLVRRLLALIQDVEEARAAPGDNLIFRLQDGIVPQVGAVNAMRQM